jgi:ABC-type nitrate/sulfonate/bicarbonate transport system permease component
MAIFVTVLVLALWIFSVFSLSLPNEILPAPFHVNVTTGGFLDDLPECSVSTVHLIPLGSVLLFVVGCIALPSVGKSMDSCAPNATED